MQLALTTASAPPSERAYNAKHSWSQRQGIILTAQDHLGNCVRSEAAPLPAYSPDTFDDALRWLQQAQPQHYPDPATSGLARLLAVLRKTADSAPASARFGFDFAFLQLAAKRQSVPLRKLLNPACKAPSRRVSARLLDLHRSDLAQQLERFSATAVPAVKVKLGRSLPTELQALELVRRHLPDVALRADANGAWSYEQGMAALSELQVFGLELLEEPFRLDSAPPAEQVPPLPLPIAWDESLFQRNPQDAQLLEWLGREDCRALILKPMCLGGCERLQQWVQTASSTTCEVIFSHVFDGSYAAHIYSELAAAWGSRTLAMGLGQQSEHLPW